MSYPCQPPHDDPRLCPLSWWAPLQRMIALKRLGLDWHTRCDGMAEYMSGRCMRIAAQCGERP